MGQRVGERETRRRERDERRALVLVLVFDSANRLQTATAVLLSFSLCLSFSLPSFATAQQCCSIGSMTAAAVVMGMRDASMQRNLRREREGEGEGEEGEGEGAPVLET